MRGDSSSQIRLPRTQVGRDRKSRSNWPATVEGSHRRASARASSQCLASNAGASQSFSITATHGATSRAVGVTSEFGPYRYGIVNTNPALVTLSASSHQGTVYGERGETNRFVARIAWFGDILKVEGPLVEIGPRSVFPNSELVERQSPAGEGPLMT
jgi:hypothetical protein